MSTEPNMSDTTLLVTVEDLINRAMGPPDVNAVNFKLIQMVLQILARQQRILQQRVEIKVSELADLGKTVKKSTEVFPSKSSRLEKRRVADNKEEREKDKQAVSFKEKEREELKEKERDERNKLKEKEKAEEIAQKEQEKAGKTVQKKQEKAERVVNKEQEMAEKSTQKQQGKAEKLAQKEGEAEKAALKEQEKAANLELKEHETAQEGQEKVAIKEQEKVAQKEQEKAQIAQEKVEKAGLKGQEEVQKDEEKTEKAAIKKQEKAGKEALKDQEKAQMTQKKVEKAGLKLQEEIQKDEEKTEKTAIKEQEKAGKEALKDQEKAQMAQEKVEKAGLKGQEEIQKDEEKTEKAAIKEQKKAGKEALKEQEEALKAEEKAALYEQEKVQNGQEKTEMSALKGQKEVYKEQKKTEKAAIKELEKVHEDQEKTEKAAIKILEKVQEGQEKTEKRDQLEKEKPAAEKEAEKEKERSVKKQKKAYKEKARPVEEEESQPTKEEQKKDVIFDAGISAKETLRGKESVLVVEKGPTTRLDSRSRSNIDVVTQSQFSMLEEAVRQLKNVAIPKTLKMPDNEKLRSDLAKGTATLPDTMQAMQVEARLKAAEATIGRMSGLLTQLSAASAADLSGKVETVVAEAAVAVEKQDQSQAKRHESFAPKKLVLIDSKISQASPSVEQPAVVSRLEVQPSAPSVSVDIPRPSHTTTPRTSKLFKASITSTASIRPGVTQEEMDSALRDLSEEIFNYLQGLVSHAATTADNALFIASSIANKLDLALKLDARISSLFTIVGDYAQQLSGYDAGLTTQMQNFKDQIGQMRADLQVGLAQLENVNNKAETAAVIELTERYTELVTEQNSTVIAHNSLQRLQGQLGDELRSLVECVEMLREQKCDRDEVLDGLRDKADISRLTGLLAQTKFARARSDFERRLDLCHEKFGRQDAMWTTAIKDLTGLMDQKAELVELLSLRDLVQKELQELHDRLRELAFALGEPKAALLMRMMSPALCGACRAAALMEPQEAESGIPQHLPPLRPPPTPEPCTRWVRPEQPLKRHACHRWVGGSHTLLKAGGPVERESVGRTPAAIELRRVHKYTGYGDDGRQYLMEEDLQPCIQCNSVSKSEVAHSAAEGGDAH